MEIVLIAAVDSNGAIGKDNKLCWHIPEDFAHFQRLTKFNPVVMGRKTHESIGKNLPKRINMIMTRKSRDEFTPPSGAYTFDSVDDVITEFKDYDGKVYIIGGEEIYNEFISIADSVVLTRVHMVIEEPDAYFPMAELDADEWKLGNIVHNHEDGIKFDFCWFHYNGGEE